MHKYKNRIIGAIPSNTTAAYWKDNRLISERHLRSSWYRYDKNNNNNKSANSSNTRCCCVDGCGTVHILLFCGIVHILPFFNTVHIWHLLFGTGVLVLQVTFTSRLSSPLRSCVWYIICDQCSLHCITTSTTHRPLKHFLCVSSSIQHHYYRLLLVPARSLQISCLYQHHAPPANHVRPVIFSSYTGRRALTRW